MTLERLLTDFKRAFGAITNRIGTPDVCIEALVYLVATLNASHHSFFDIVIKFIRDVYVLIVTKAYCW
jgi:hypothetical protein